VEKNIIKKIRDFFKKEIPDFASYIDETPKKAKKNTDD
jgi:hypothetical protein